MDVCHHSVHQNWRFTLWINCVGVKGTASLIGSPKLWANFPIFFSCAWVLTNDPILHQISMTFWCLLSTVQFFWGPFHVRLLMLLRCLVASIPGLICRRSRKPMAAFRELRGVTPVVKVTLVKGFSKDTWTSQNCEPTIRSCIPFTSMEGIL